MHEDLMTPDEDEGLVMCLSIVYNKKQLAVKAISYFLNM